MKKILSLLVMAIVAIPVSYTHLDVYKRQTDSRQFAKCVDIQVCIGEVIFNQTDNVRQKFLILRFCFDRFKYGERFQLFFGCYDWYFVFLYSNDRNAQPDGSSLSFFGGDSIDRTAV